MYREPAAREPTDLPPTKLVLAGRERLDPNAWFGWVSKWISLPLVASMAVASVAGPELAVLTALLYFAYLFLQRRTKPNPETRIELEGRYLHVHRPGAGRAIQSFRTPVSAVLDVVLDTKTEASLQDSQTAIQELRYETARAGPTIDTARVLIVSELEDKPFALSESYLANYDAIEQMGKVRAFLRKHGWVPESERPDDVPPSSG